MQITDLAGTRAYWQRRRDAGPVQGLESGVIYEFETHRPTELAHEPVRMIFLLSTRNPADMISSGNKSTGEGKSTSSK